MKAEPEKNRAIRTYFLLLLLFSDGDSLRYASSDGGVAELFSFLARAAGMSVGRGMIIGCDGNAGSKRLVKSCVLIFEAAECLLSPWHTCLQSATGQTQNACFQ
jgi:hypothetical protein